jgi:biopolymer transport protein ExbB/TolQ
MLVIFHTIGQTSTSLTPEQLARGISIAMVPALAVVPLGVLGILLLILVLLFRRRVAKQEKLDPR